MSLQGHLSRVFQAFDVDVPSAISVMAEDFLHDLDEEDLAACMRDPLLAEMIAKSCGFGLSEDAPDLDEGNYEDDVKRASKLAANATAAAKASGSPEHHDAAARLHFIAHGIANSYGHEDLAAKHLDFHKKHSQQAAMGIKTG